MTLIRWPSASAYIIMYAFIRLLPAMIVPALVILTGRLMRILINTIPAKFPAPKTVQRALRAYVLFAATDISSAMTIHVKRKKAVLPIVPTVTKRPENVQPVNQGITSAMTTHAKKKKAARPTVPTVIKPPAYALPAAADITFPAAGVIPVRKMRLVTGNHSSAMTVTRKRTEPADHRKQFIPVRRV